MRNKKDNNRGMGRYQRNKMYEATREILQSLSDGQWHRPIELKQTTKLSSRTLAKHLEKLTKLTLIERREDKESGKYPTPVFYKATSGLMGYILHNQEIEFWIENNKAWLEKTHDPLSIMDTIHFISLSTFTSIINFLQENNNIDLEQIDILKETFLWQNYSILTNELINECYKIKNKINLPELILSQAKRQKETWERIIKQLENNQEPTMTIINQTKRKNVYLFPSAAKRYLGE